MSSSPKRVPVRYFVPLCDSLRAQGVDMDQVMRMARIAPERFERSDEMLLPGEVDAFIVAMRQLSGRTDLGFEIGRMIKINSHDILGYGMLSCRNLDHVLRLSVRYYHLMNEMFTLRYQRTPEQGIAVYSPVIPMPLEMLRFYLEGLAVSHHNQMQMMLGAQIGPYDIRLSMPPPPHIARYRQLAPARFDFDETSLPGVTVTMNAALLDAPLPMAAPQVVRQVEERCETLQRRPVPDGAWGEYVTMMLRETRGSQFTLDDLAQRMNISARTIDRHLKKENLQFRDLSQRVRFETACVMLAESGATVVQVAQRLGFSDAGNFSRAFRNFMGVSPSEYQQRGGSVIGG